MYTRWRLYILAVLLALIAACLFAVHLLRKRGLLKTPFQAFLFTAGIVLTAETVIVSTLSNYNLGVILPANVVRVCGILMIRSCRQPTDRQADAVIVLGAAVHGDKVTWVLENRLNTAKDYLDAHPDCVCVVSGGMGSGENVTEASAMKKYLVERGVDPSRVLTEEQATNTPENFLYSKAIIDDTLGSGAEIAFVTTDFHIFRAGGVAKSLGIDAFGIPAPDVWYLRLNNFLRECVGICVYKLRGQI